jgi:hypothetical protein
MQFVDAKAKVIWPSAIGVEPVLPLPAGHAFAAR